MAAPYIPDEATHRADVIARVAARIEDGALNADAARAEGYSEDTIRRWCNADPALDAVHTRARLIGAHALAEKAVSVALGKEVDGTKYADPQERKLAYDALRWLAGKRRPKDYGDRVEHEHSGTVGHLHLDALRIAQSTQRNVSNANALTRLPDPTVNAIASPTPIEASSPESLPTAREAPPSLTAGTGLVEGGGPQSAAVSPSVSALTPQSAVVPPSSASVSTSAVASSVSRLPWSATAAERAEWARVHGGGVEPPSTGGESQG